MIGAVPTIGPYLLPNIISRFLNRYPRVEFLLREDVTQHLLKALHEGELDIALVALPVDDSQMQSLVLRQERLLVGMPSKHRLARRKSIALAELEQEPFILLSDMHCLAGQVTSFCESHFVPKIACLCVQLTTIQQLIGLRLGISLVPELACNADTQKSVVYRPMDSPEPTRTLGFIWHQHRHLSPNVTVFLEQAAELFDT